MFPEFFRSENSFSNSQIDENLKCHTLVLLYTLVLLSKFLKKSDLLLLLSKIRIKYREKLKASSNSISLNHSEIILQVFI